MLWAVKYTRLLKEYLPIKESSWQKIHLSLCRNKKQTVKASQYDWSSLPNSDISNPYTGPVRNKFVTFQETSERHIPNNKYKNIVTVYIKAAYQPNQEPNVEFPES